jgi:hypothetical protein
MVAAAVTVWRAPVRGWVRFWWWWVGERMGGQTSRAYGGSAWALAGPTALPLGHVQAVLHLWLNTPAQHQGVLPLVVFHLSFLYTVCSLKFNICIPNYRTLRSSLRIA